MVLTYGGFGKLKMCVWGWGTGGGYGGGEGNYFIIIGFPVVRGHSVTLKSQLSPKSCLVLVFHL